MNKCHQNINWQNDTTPAINETNLNYMDGCLDTIDDRVVALANDPPANALKSEGWAIGEQNGVPVTSDSPYYENNSKYYSQESANEVLKSEGFANGTQGGVPVSSGSPYYENNAKYWRDQAHAIVSNSLAGLDDVDITTPADGQALTYDSNSGDWVNNALLFSKLADADIVSPQTNDTLVFDGTTNKWINVHNEYKTFATASDVEIVRMVALADAGIIDLYDDCGWRVGQERQVSLTAIDASGTFDGVSWSVGESQSAQTITLVLMHKGLYELVTPVLDKQGQTRNTCSFVVGVKDELSTVGYMNTTDTNSGSWNGCARRNWCNGGFREALPATLRAAFKKFKTITAQTYNGSTNQVSEDYFTLPAEKEVEGSRQHSNSTEASALTQFTWYSTSSNQIKKLNGTGNVYWLRSPYSGNSSEFCVEGSGGNPYHYPATLGNTGISPFGCL